MNYVALSLSLKKKNIIWKLSRDLTGHSRIPDTGAYTMPSSSRFVWPEMQHIDSPPYAKAQDLEVVLGARGYK